MAEVTMPRLGVSVTEGTLSTWLKQVGDEVALGEAICEVSTDKVDTEIESTVAGVLIVQLVAEGEIVAVGAPLASVGAADGVPATQAPTEAPPIAPVPHPEDEAGPDRSLEPVSEPAADFVRMPRLGVSVTEGTVSTWLKQVGDEVALGEAICEVSTDKVDTEIESTVAGVLTAQLVAEGQVVAVGEPLAALGGLAPVPSPVAPVPSPVAPVPEGDLASSVPAAEVAAVSQLNPERPRMVTPGPFDHHVAVDRTLASANRGDRPAASPAARSLADELGVDLAAVVPTEGRAHLTRADVQRRAADWPESPQPPVPAATVVLGPPASEASAPESVDLPGYEDVPFEVLATSRIRQVTAEHMTRSRRTAAHMTTEVDVDLGLLTSVRERLNSRRLGQGQSKLSFLPFIARATCAALLDHPDLNATFEPQRLVRWGEVNLGVAVDTPRGLMVPVIRGAEQMTVATLAQAIADVASRVRDGKAGVDDFRAGTFTISNPGSVGAVSAPAIINQPQVGILGMPTIVRRPWVVRLPDGQETIAIRPIIRLALTFDHRAVDGADATRCLVDVKRRLEEWDEDGYR